MFIVNRGIWTGLALAAVSTASLIPISHAGLPTFGRKLNSVERLAKGIDDIERHVDTYGSIVAKTPDIWGQARLTRHRAEVERILAGKLENGFIPGLQASVVRSDQAFLAQAISIEAALGGNRATVSSNTGNIGSTLTQTTRSLRSNDTTTNSSLRGTSDNPIGILQSFGSDANSSATNSQSTEGQNTVSRNVTRTAQDVPSPAVDNLEETVSTLTSKFAASNPLSFDSARFDGQTIGLEPTVVLDQHHRFLQHLNELRRINEGDDTSDAPGYSLNLVRIPISVLPGAKTHTGYGAEITVTATPYLAEELLPVTFRQLVVRDLQHQIAVPLTQALNNRRVLELMPDFQFLARFLDSRQPPVDWWKNDFWYPGTTPGHEEGVALWIDLLQKLLNRPELVDHLSSSTQKAILDAIMVADHKIPQEYASLVGGFFSELEKSGPSDLKSLLINISQYMKKSDGFQKPDNNDAFMTHVLAPMAPTIARAVGEKIWPEVVETLLSTGVTRTRNSTNPFPLSQFSTVYGQGVLLRVILDAYTRPGQSGKTEHVHFHDVESYLLDELTAAHELLTAPGNESLWQFCTPELVTAIRSRQRVLSPSVPEIRESFFQHLVQLRGVESANTTTAAFAWAIIVDSALLNERLVRDMRETASNRGCNCMPTDWQLYVGPDPSPEARHAFMEYVRCRWPIHVFALDPVTQDQNVADVFSRRREFQLVVALAIATGKLKLRSLTEYKRLLEMDMETIDLNRTIVGFAHGDNTFGWRFFPRVQSPIEKSNRVVHRELLRGGPSKLDDLADRRIESGIRECTALVLMPSFVPCVHFDTRANWFALKDYKRKKTELDVADHVRLSKSIKAMEDSFLECKQDETCFRNGEVQRLFRRVYQLSNELPMQTLVTQMPHENSLGGFEMFHQGTSDLAPELFGFYGEPGVIIGSENGTELFLVGDHFSVHDTQVIAGGRKIAPTLLSRQVMCIKIPGNVNVEPMESKDKLRFVDIHIASPYGVSGHLKIPVYSSLETTASENAAAAAIAAHVQQEHVTSYRWDSPEDVHAILVRTPLGVKQFQFHQDSINLQLPIIDASAVPDVTDLDDTPFTPVTANVAMFVNWIDEAGAVLPRKGKLGPYSVTFNRKRALLPLKQIQDDLGKTLIALNRDQILQGLQLEGYIKFTNTIVTPAGQPNTLISDQPIYKIKQVVTVSIAEFNEPIAVSKQSLDESNTSTREQNLPDSQDASGPVTIPQTQLPAASEVPAGLEQGTRQRPGSLPLRNPKYRRDEDESPSLVGQRSTLRVKPR